MGWNFLTGNYTNKMSNKETSTIDEELWRTAIENAIDADIFRLLSESSLFKGHADKCGCASCHKKSVAKEEDATDASAHWFYDEPTFEEEVNRDIG